MLLTDADRKRIADAIAAAESKSAGEIVVADVPRSDEYALQRGAVALVMALVVTELALLFVALPATAAVAAVGLLTPAFWWLLGAPVVLRALAGKTVAAEAVERRAFEMFSERGVHHTRERTGVLILISELEHRVVILGDVGIDAKLGKDGWEREVGVLIAAIQKGRTADGVIEVVGDMATTLAAHFPRRSDDANELSNRVTREP